MGLNEVNNICNGSKGWKDKEYKEFASIIIEETNAWANANRVTFGEKYAFNFGMRDGFGGESDRKFGKTKYKAKLLSLSASVADEIVERFRGSGVRLSLGERMAAVEGCMHGIYVCRLLRDGKKLR